VPKWGAVRRSFLLSERGPGRKEATTRCRVERRSPLARD